MIVWVTPVEGELLETLTAAQAAGIYPEAPEVGMILADIAVGEWQRAQIGGMMARGKRRTQVRAVKDGAALDKLYRAAEKARAQEPVSDG